LSVLPAGAALIETRTPDGPLLALARADSFTIGGDRFTIVGGVAAGARFLARLERGTDLSVSLDLPGPGPDGPSGRAIVRELLVPYIDADRAGRSEAALRVSHDLAGLEELRRGIDRWLLAAVAIAAIAAVILVAWLSARISRPLTELADKTARIDLDRLDVDFETDREDEIGALSRLLGEMTGRLRAGASRVRDAERRATLGEMARQVNHDIRNGLTPIRNVVRHLTELLRDDPGRLPEVFGERRETLDSSIAYLDDLASSYARLYPRSERGPCDASESAARVVADMRGTGGVDIGAELAGDAVVQADPVALRRILENLVRNAIESIGPGAGTVTLKTERVAGEDDGGIVRISVSDTGRGMTGEQRGRIFDDFYTTKEGGTGLGLSIVRRLVTDLGGTIEVESEPGRGSRFVITLPASGGA
ncbi:MAG: HAMP domain-containing sensor histidine kinase, partial [Candidatus Krumholzibacteria bacterium]|nr:HAMP domain-containing sensor histidine kinase [Candidatus Krumholzibacteria bacterium]